MDHSKHPARSRSLVGPRGLLIVIGSFGKANNVLVEEKSGPHEQRKPAKDDDGRGVSSDLLVE